MRLDALAGGCHTSASLHVELDCAWCGWGRTFRGRRRVRRGMECMLRGMGRRPPGNCGVLQRWGGTHREMGWVQRQQRRLPRGAPWVLRVLRRLPRNSRGIPRKLRGTLRVLRAVLRGLFLWVLRVVLNRRGGEDDRGLVVGRASCPTSGQCLEMHFNPGSGPMAGKMPAPPCQKTDRQECLSYGSLSHAGCVATA